MLDSKVCELFDEAMTNQRATLLEKLKAGRPLWRLVDAIAETLEANSLNSIASHIRENRDSYIAYVEGKMGVN